MKTTASILLAVAMVIGPAPTVSVSAKQDPDPNFLTITLSDPDRPATLNVRMFQGDVTINAHAGRDVIVTVNAAAFRPDPDVRGLRRLTGGRFSVEEDNNVVSIRGDRSDTGDISIQVPTGTNLQIESTNGEIDVEGVDGDIEVTTMNEAVTLTNVAGSVVAYSQNDDLRVTMTRLTPDKLMSFSSVNGDVDVTLPADTGANLRMSTVNGDIYTDFEVQLDAIEDDGAIRRGNRIDIGRDLTGAINGGGPVFEFRTVNGDIFIRTRE